MASLTTDSTGSTTVYGLLYLPRGNLYVSNWPRSFLSVLKNMRGLHAILEFERSDLELYRASFIMPSAADTDTSCSRTNLLPTIQPPQQSAATASPGGRPATKASPLADTIGRFVKEYYDASMTLVASLELALWFRILFSAILFTKGSWILLAIYTVFIRARYSQSSFVQGAVGQFSHRVDALMANQSVPPAVRQGWETVKGVSRRAVSQTDINRLAGGQQPGARKAQ